MGSSRLAAGILLILIITLQVPPSLGQRSRPTSAETRKRLHQRLQRLDEQFRRFQEMTLTHLRSIAESSNLSTSIDTRFHMLTRQLESISRELSSFRTEAERDLQSLKSWSRKLRRKTKRLELRLTRTERVMKENCRLALNQLHKHKAAMVNLTQELVTHRGRINVVEARQGEIKVLQEAFQKQISKLDSQVRSIQRPLLGTYLVRSENALNRTVQGPAFTKRKEKTRLSKDSKDERMKNRVLLRATRQPDHMTVATFMQTNMPPTSQSVQEEQTNTLLHLPQRHKIPQNYTPKKAATICNVNSVLFFPSASTENYVTFRTRFLTSIHELSICTWLRVDAEYMGTLLSYATEANDNTLVLYGRRSSLLGNMDFVIGDPAYRELTTDHMLDGQWHHICVVWSSIEGRFWHYMDRRLISTGSRFQKGYEIPPGGSFILGQEQDTLGGGFDQAEAFVGRLAGFALWTRALSPAEVSGLASGRGMPRGAVLTLDDVNVLHGSVKQVICECLEHCI
ncbi:pentraxin-4 [Astyanax mexicanus]|uniref:Pentraxin-4 n=1 Tax=Astyanax mexicanus TaxID=7994 RepID=A0A8T2KYF6_ASTMX|nr:pentraxin-4 [Astyanax mexicanus]